jgi:hypothetical protein
MVLEGRAFLASMPAAQYSDKAPGTLLYQFDLNPLNVTNARLHAFASLFERYDFQYCAITFDSAVGNNTNGALIAYWERDLERIDVTENAGDLTIAQVTDHAAKKRVKLDTAITQTKNWYLPAKAPREPEYYIYEGSSGARLTTQGRFKLYSLATAPLSGSSPGTLWIEFRVRLYQAVNPAPPSPAGTCYVYWDDAEDFNVPTGQWSSSGVVSVDYHHNLAGPWFAPRIRNTAWSSLPQPLRKGLWFHVSTSITPAESASDMKLLQEAPYIWRSETSFGFFYDLNFQDANPGTSEFNLAAAALSEPFGDVTDMKDEYPNITPFYQSESHGPANSSYFAIWISWGYSASFPPGPALGKTRKPIDEDAEGLDQLMADLNRYRDAFRKKSKLRDFTDDGDMKRPLSPKPVSAELTGPEHPSLGAKDEHDSVIVVPQGKSDAETLKSALLALKAAGVHLQLAGAK